MSANGNDIAGQAGSLAAPAPVWLAAFRAQARDRLGNTRFPAKRTEAWKYSSTQALADSGALQATAAGGAAPAAADFSPWQLVVVNGRLDRTRSRLPDDASLVIATLAELPAAERAQAEALLAQTDSARLPFAALNDAAFTDGIYVRAARLAAPAQPLQVVFHTTGTAPATATTRLLVRLDEGAALTLIEQYTTQGSRQFCNAATAVELARDARLTHLRAGFEADGNFHIGSVDWKLAGNAHCAVHQFQAGIALKRQDLSCTFTAPGGELHLAGAMLAGRGCHLDQQVRIEHAAPQCASKQVFKGIAGADGRIVFNGRIHIHAGARGSDAQLTNNNLLLSADAEIDTKPELEIYNDDVACSHGATVGQLNEQAVYYLQSRGIARAEAELMLSLGFINALVDGVPLPAAQDWLRHAVGDWFAQRSRA
jgi:Fe-S cluster assembly protein SufD